MAESTTAEELPKAYEPAAVEAKWQSHWETTGCFRADETSDREGYSIVIPPPNVTGVLHLGHVLNNTLQDILARRARQQGKEVLWLPGCDHAGIATQTRVEKELRQNEKKTRHDYGREAFLEKVWEWKEKHGAIIFDQLRRLGCSLDWSRERFTMDPEYSRWVAHVFCDLFAKGLIHRGRRMVNWCPVSLTALSDEEVIMKPRRGKLYTMRYEIVDAPGTYLLISTTRPETLMADTAVAVHPDDDRYRDLIGKTVWRPFPKEAIPVVADAHVEKEFGTGCLKVTPAHDKADFEIGLRHGLPVVDVLTPDAKIDCPSVPDLHGLDRFIARKKAAEMLAEMGLLEKEEDYENNVGFSERADVPIEPRLSMQWFLKYPSVDRTAAAVADGTIAFRPDRWKKTFAHWMENLQDWCISRQLWWGHRIPVWYRKDKADALKAAEKLDPAAVAAGDLHVGTDAPADPENWVQDDDVLDTWFSSWLWPFATMTDLGDRSPTLRKFYPTTDLVTGPDIIFFWVARMIMAGYEYENAPAFHNVYFTSIIRDLKGQKMSKSLGNSPDPLDLIAKYGADGLRFGLLRIAPSGQDVRFDEKQIEEGRNFANKLWNACRFRQMWGQAGEDAAAPGIFEIDILAKLDDAANDIENGYAEYQFNHIAQRLYDFFWGDYCDQFLEAVKGDLRETAPPARRASVLRTMDTVLRRFLPLLHAYMPHISSELWEKFGFGHGTPLTLAPLPGGSALDGLGLEAEAIATSRRLAGAIYESAAIARRLKAENNLASNRGVKFVLAGSSATPEALATLAQLAGAASVETADATPANAPKTLTPLGELALPLEGLIDAAAERARLTREITRIEGEIQKSRGKLGNASFVDRAPPEVVVQEKERLADWEEKLAATRRMLEALPGA